MSTRSTAMLMFSLVVLSFTRCHSEPQAPAQEEGPPRAAHGVPVILISIDTLRADHVGAYGYRRPTTPNLDALANESVLFEECIAQAPSTLPSHASLFTSRLVSHHGALFSRRHKLPDSATTMAELLRAAGFSTMGLHDGGQMDAYLGLGQGFDTYALVQKPGAGSEFRRTVASAKRLLDERRSDRFLLFLHTYGVHTPYCDEARFTDLFHGDYQGPLPRCLTVNLLQAINSKKLPIDAADARHITNMYDAGIRSVDASLGELFSHLKALGLYERSLIVVTSDHGEELGERGRYGWHSHALFDEQLRVPLVVKLPEERFKGQRVSAQVRAIDILPTMLDVLGESPPPTFEGRSALGLAQGKAEAQPRLAVSERDVTDTVLPAVLRSLEWKLDVRPHERQSSLFHLSVDPGETTDVLSERPEIAQQLRQALETTLSSQRAPAPASPARESLPRHLAKQLRALGYLSEPPEDAK